MALEGSASMGTGKLELPIPRDRLSTFDPQLIAKCQRRFPGFARSAARWLQVCGVGPG